MVTVFISHSVREDPLAAKYLEAIRVWLEKNGHEVLLDRIRLKVSDDWNAVIVNWMYVCDVAIVLFSEKALASSYLLFEVSNLVGRLRREADRAALPGESPVKVCPVFLPGIDIDQIKKGFFGAIKLELLQAIGPCSEEEVLKQLAKVLPAGSVTSTLLDEQVAMVADIVKDRDTGVLRAAAKAAGLDLKLDTAPTEYPKRLARHLCTCRLGQVMAALQKLRPSLGDRTNDILDLVAPSWVSLEAALELREMLHTVTDAPSRRCAIINGEKADFTPEMYLRRARGLLKRDAGTVVQVNPPEGVNAADALVREVRDALVVELNVEAGATTAETDAAIAGAIRSELMNKSLPVLVAVARGTMPATDYFAVLDTLQQQPFLDQVTFVGLYGPEPPDNEGRPEWQHVLWPPLGDRQEASARSTYQSIFDPPRPKPSPERP